MPIGLKNLALNIKRFLYLYLVAWSGNFVIRTVRVLWLLLIQKLGYADISLIQFLIGDLFLVFVIVVRIIFDLDKMNTTRGEVNPLFYRTGDVIKFESKETKEKFEIMVEEITIHKLNLFSTRVDVKLKGEIEND